MLTKLSPARYWSEWAAALKASPAKTLPATFRNTAIGNKLLHDTASRVWCELHSNNHLGS